ncbi:hypothetical protein ACET3X_008504 [Alternaria dauci]|uniref:Uncharacterized protein n=1 Tax=Alternaria dauci TaxID=48095 RepID=A0ABR3UAJ4_9PLEO
MSENDGGTRWIAQLMDTNEDDLPDALHRLWATFQLHQLDSLAAQKTTQAAELEARSAVLSAQAEAHKSEAAALRLGAAKSYEEAASIRLLRARRDLEAWPPKEKKC